MTLKMSSPYGSHGPECICHGQKPRVPIPVPAAMPVPQLSPSPYTIPHTIPYTIQSPTPKTSVQAHHQFDFPKGRKRDIWCYIS